MRPLALLIVLAAAVACPQDRKVEDDDRLVLDSDKVGETVEVRPGEEVVLKLPGGMPFWWVPTEGKDALERVFEEGQDRDILPFEEMKEPGERPALGRPKWFKPVYRVKAEPGREVKVKWVYSRSGKPPRKEDCEPFDPDACRDEDGAFDLGKFKAGLEYTVTLKVVE
jgi:hypothetical protein